MSERSEAPLPEPLDDVAGAAVPTVVTTTADAKVRKVELLISGLLRTGVLASLVLVLVGTVLTFAHHTEYLTTRSELHPLISKGATFPHTLPDIVDGVFRLDGPSVVAAGLLVLVATPVLRVAISIAAFAYQRDRTFVVITTAVLLLLLSSFALGKAGG